MYDNENRVGYYVDDVIGEAYKEWKWGDIILLTAPTGRGKTHFVLYTLLLYAIMTNRKILYVVNRKILKEQLKKELRNEVEMDMLRKLGGLPYPLENYISIKTYQGIEASIKKDLDAWRKSVSQFDYVVYDECHYFYADATFNTSTELSHDALRREFDSKIQLFISATMKNVEKVIMKRSKVFLCKNEMDYISSLNRNISNSYGSSHIHTYTVEKNYDYINPIIFGELDDLIDEIICSKKKWLVFVDNIERGKKFKKDLSDAFGKDKEKENEEEKVVFIDANYEDDAFALKEVNTLIENNFIGKKVVITTAVMDNGISFFDDELSNLVILADSEEIFLQMLGRKREDGKTLNLYICPRSRQHFVGRKKHAEDLLSFWRKYGSTITMNQQVTIGADCEKKVVEQLTPYAHYLYRRGLAEQEAISIYVNGTYGKNVLFTQRWVINDILNSIETYKKAAKLCYTLDGTININAFALEQINNSLLFYDKIIEAMSEDMNAFIRKQLEWLGYDNDKCEAVIRENEVRYTKPIVTALKPVIGNTISAKEMQKLKEPIRKELKYFILQSSMCDESNMRKVIRPDGTITPELFNEIMGIAKLPFCLEKSGQKFLISEIMENE